MSKRAKTDADASEEHEGPLESVHYRVMIEGKNRVLQAHDAEHTRGEHVELLGIPDLSAPVFDTTWSTREFLSLYVPAVTYRGSGPAGLGWVFPGEHSRLKWAWCKPSTIDISPWPRGDMCGAYVGYCYYGTKKNVVYARVHRAKSLTVHRTAVDDFDTGTSVLEIGARDLSLKGFLEPGADERLKTATALTCETVRLVLYKVSKATPPSETVLETPASMTASL